MSIYEFTKGKKVDVDYETGYHFVITYLSENKLHWDALSKTAEGAPAHEDEPYTSYDLGDGKYMVNWILTHVAKADKVWAKFMTEKK